MIQHYAINLLSHVKCPNYLSICVVKLPSIVLVFAECAYSCVIRLLAKKKIFIHGHESVLFSFAVVILTALHVYLIHHTVELPMHGSGMFYFFCFFRMIGTHSSVLISDAKGFV